MKKKKRNNTADEENKFYEEQKVCNICKKGFSIDNDKKRHKVRDLCHYTGNFRGAARSICSLRYKTPKEISIVFHNGSTYDYHFIIKKLAKDFFGQLECLGENTEKYITFSALDLCQPHYQVLLIIYLKKKKKKKKAKDSRKKEKSNQYAILRCKECKKIQLNQ